MKKGRESPKESQRSNRRRPGSRGGFEYCGRYENAVVFRQSANPINKPLERPGKRPEKSRKSERTIAGARYRPDAQRRGLGTGQIYRTVCVRFG